jgi:hypothetical protein
MLQGWSFRSLLLLQARAVAACECCKCSFVRSVAAIWLISSLCTQPDTGRRARTARCQRVTCLTGLPLSLGSWRSDRDHIPCGEPGDGRAEAGRPSLWHGAADLRAAARRLFARRATSRWVSQKPYQSLPQLCFLPDAHQYRISPAAGDGGP